MPLKIYDKVSWHYPDGKNCPDLKAASLHFRTLVSWLGINGFLSKYGKYIAGQEVDEDFSITSEMLTPEGNRLLSNFYDEWLKTVEYGKTPSVSFWEGKKDEV